MKFETDGGGEMAAREYFSTGTAFTPDTVPEKEGYRFLHWTDGSNTYAPGAALPAEDCILTAVYEKLPEPEKEPEAPDREEESHPSEEPGESETPGQDGAGDVHEPETPADSIGEPPKNDHTTGDVLQNPKATAAAAVVSGVLTALLAAWYFCRKFV